MLAVRLAACPSTLVYVNIDYASLMEARVITQNLCLKYITMSIAQARHTPTLRKRLDASSVPSPVDH